MEHIRWFLVVVVLCTFTGMVSAVPVVQVEPEHIEVSQGDVFGVNITVYPEGNEIYGAQYTLSFDNTLLNATDQTQGAFLSQGGVETIVYENVINNTIGEIKYSESRTGGVTYSVIDPGVLATIKFEVLGESGTCELRLDEVKITDPTPIYVADVSVSNGRCTIKSIGTSTPTTIEPPSTATTIPTTVAASSETPTATPATTATAVQVGAVDQTPTLPEPHSTATLSATPKPTTSHPTEENTEQSGFSTAFVTVGLIILLYAILKVKR